MADQRYGGVIWTNHALSRLHDRGLTQELAWYTFKHADKTLKGKEQGTTEFHRKEKGSTITVIAKQSEKKEWIIISCWANPPLPGSMDIVKQQDYKKYKNSGFFEKFFYDLKRQFGL